MTLAPLHFHQLKRLADSPAHYLYRLTHWTPPARAMRMGSAVDKLVYDPRLQAEFDAMPESFQLTTAAELALGDKGPPKRGESHLKDGGHVLGMYHALRNHGDAWDLLTTGTAQQTIQWSLSGRTCEGTPDNFTRSRLVSLKTTRSAHPDRFVRDARFRAYHAAESWYAFGLTVAGLSTPTEVLTVAVENEPPYPVTVFELTEGALEAGEKLWRSWFERLRVCEESDTFPGYAAARVPFDVFDAELDLVFDDD